MKKLVLFFLILTIQALSAQVGVFTPFPKARFHVDGKGNNPKDSSSSSVSSDDALDDFVVTAEGQVGIGIIKPTPSTSLDIFITKGLRLPQVNSTQKTALTSLIASDVDKGKGLLIYNTSNKTIEFYNGTVWVSLPVID